ncbi:MAG: class I SAM-dependent RNA methyltransferase [Gemmatimonadaceae bacterium]|nr:class I SAM-dependent RNA methyltransferase [Gemmatimonadaceae bacterium]
MKRPARRSTTRLSARTGHGGAPTETVANIRIDSIAAGGDGVGRIDGMACFVPRTAAGDVAQVAYVPHARYARGRVLQLLEMSPDRTEPRCHHYVADRCGGCQLQHLTHEAQRNVRRHIVRDALQRVGRREVPLPEIVSGIEWEYRERLTLALRSRGTNWIGGLHAFDDAGRIFALDECPIAHPRLTACWSDLRRQLRGLPQPRPGTTLRLSLRLMGNAQVAVVVQGGWDWRDGAPWAAQVHANVALIGAIWWEPDAGAAVMLSGELNSDVLAFAQVNPVVATALREHVLTIARSFTPASVIDAYSGRGEIAESLARDGARVTAIEADRMATMRAAERLAEFDAATVITARVEDVLADVLPAELVVLNPPRRGVDIRVAATLAESAPHGVRAIVYVSCDPATLARDLSRLPRWRIASVRCFDMFPQTAHVETVCVLIPENS